MNNMTPKRPLAAVLLTIFMPGLGHIYLGHYVFGLFILVLPVILGAAYLYWLIHPDTTTSVFLVFPLVLYLFFGIYLCWNSYHLAKAHNVQYGLDGSTSWKRKLIYFGIWVLYCVMPIPSPSLAIAQFIKSDIVQAFKIPSGAMRLTLMEGDRLLVDKAIYKSIRPTRGDIIVFDYPKEPERQFIKRIVAIGGDRVEILGGQIYINGILETNDRITKHHYYNKGPYGQPYQPVQVPEEHYFVLGDNSASSHDSRFWGFVPEENIVGKVYKIYWPMARSGPIH